MKRLVLAAAFALPIAILLFAAHATLISRNQLDRKRALGIPLTVSLAPQRLHKGLYRIVDALQVVFPKHGIVFWACAGTALGLERHGSIIPWDDDVDLCVQGSLGAEVLGVLQQDLDAFKLKVLPYSFGFKVVDFFDRDIFADIFFTAQVDDRIVYASPSARKSWPKEWFESSCTREIVLRSFGPTTVPALPSASNLQYCERAFGKDVMRVCCRGAIHEPILGMLIFLNPFIRHCWTMPASVGDETRHY